MPAEVSAAATIADVEPFPLVPAMWTIGTFGLTVWLCR